MSILDTMKMKTMIMLDPHSKREVSGGLILDAPLEEIGERRRLSMLPLSWMTIFPAVDDWLCGLAIVPANEGYYRRVGLIFTLDDLMFDRSCPHEVTII